MVLGVGGYFLQRQMREETASLEPTTVPAIHDINETERKLEDDLRLLAKHGCLDKDETAFAQEVLEISPAEITAEETEQIKEITNRYTYCLESLRALQWNPKTHSPPTKRKSGISSGSSSCFPKRLTEAIVKARAFHCAMNEPDVLF